jgi:multimeric flavodoxin WrbA
MPLRKLNVLAFNCSLKSAGGSEKSSTDVLLKQLLKELERAGAEREIIRAGDHSSSPGSLPMKGKMTPGRACASA